MRFILLLAMGSDLIYMFLLSVEMDMREGQADDLKVLPNFELLNLSVRPDCFAS